MGISEDGRRGGHIRGWDEEVGISEDGMRRWAYQRMG